MVYAAISDGTNVSKESSFEIEDGIAPTVTVSQGAIATNSIAISVSSKDDQWGMPEPITYKCYIKKSTETEYLTEASYTETDTSYTFDNLSQTTSYDIKVTVTDKAGNEGSKELKGITTGTVGEATGDLKEGNIIASEPTWSNGTASITSSKGSDVASNLSIEWQINGIDAGGWTTGESVTGLVHNDIVYARLTDGVNYGKEASITIKNTAPTNLSMTFSSKSTNSITVNASASDVNGDRLTYSLYTSTSLSSGYTLKTSTSATAGQRVTLTASNLSMYTTYYYYVTVSDGISSQTSSKPSIRTYCSGTTNTCNTLLCNEGYNKVCTTCNGSGNVDVTCTNCEGSGQTWQYCGVCGGSGWMQNSWGWSGCSACSASGKIYYSCGECDGNGTISDGCTICNGTGNLINYCSHGYTTSHRYCTHYTNTSVTSHYYCAHNHNGVQHDD